MNNMDESRVLIEMLCRNNWREEWVPSINIDKLITLAGKNKVLCTLADFIFDNTIENYFIEAPCFSRLKEALLLNKRDLQVYRATLDLLISRFSEKNIDICLLKGLSLCCATARDMGDLDLLIGEDDLGRAIETIEELGFSYQGDKRNGFIRKEEFRDWEKLVTWSNQFEFLDHKTGLLVELHTQFFERDRVYPMNLDPFLNQIENFRDRSVWSDNLQCKILSPEDRIWLLSMHNSIKRSVFKGNFVLRNLLDMNNILIEEAVDWDFLIINAAETDTLIFLIYTLEMTKMFFPDLPIQKVISLGNQLLSKRKMTLKKTLHSCFYNLETVYYFRRFFLWLIFPFVQKSRLKHKLRSAFILPLLFPSTRQLRELYEIPSPLLFFAYVIEPLRWFKIAIEKRSKGMANPLSGNSELKQNE